MFKVDLEKAEEPEIKLSTFAGSQKKQECSRKNICFTDYTKAFVWITTTVESSERDGNTRPPYLRSWEICMQVKKQQLELDMEQQTVSW